MLLTANCRRWLLMQNQLQSFTNVKSVTFYWISLLVPHAWRQFYIIFAQRDIGLFAALWSIESGNQLHCGNGIKGTCEICMKSLHV